MQQELKFQICYWNSCEGLYRPWGESALRADQLFLNSQLRLSALLPIIIKPWLSPPPKLSFKEQVAAIITLATIAHVNTNYRLSCLFIASLVRSRLAHASVVSDTEFCCSTLLLVTCGWFKLLNFACPLSVMALFLLFKSARLSGRHLCPYIFIRKYDDRLLLPCPCHSLAPKRQPVGLFDEYLRCYSPEQPQHGICSLSRIDHEWTNTPSSMQFASIKTGEKLFGFKCRLSSGTSGDAGRPSSRDANYSRLALTVVHHDHDARWKSPGA